MVEKVSWDNPSLSLRVEFDTAAIDDIRIASIEALQALRKGGIGIGGLLWGARSGASMRVTHREEIACSHAFGPAFQLTPDEIARVPAGAQLCGLYISKPRGDMQLSDSDKVLFDRFCPDPNQIVLLVRPRAMEDSSAAAVARDRFGTLAYSAEWEVRPWFPSAGPLETEPASAPPAETLQPVVQPVAVAPPPAPSIMPPPPPPPPPSFSLDAGQPGRRGLGIAAAFMALVVGGGAAYFSRDNASYKPNETKPAETGAVVLRWTRPAAQPGGADLRISDGGRNRTIHLDSGQVDSGVREYKPESGDVRATLSLPDRSAVDVAVERKP